MEKKDLISKLVSKKLEKPAPMGDMDMEMDETLSEKEVAAQEVLDAIEAKDSKALAEAVASLVYLVKDEEIELDEEME